MTLVKRIIAEKRVLLLPLAIVLLANIAAYALLIYPLSLQVAQMENRATAAERDAQLAARDEAGARATQTGKDRAGEELTRFYSDVLPKDLSGARRITYLRLAQLARQANLRTQRRSAEPEPTRGSELQRLRISMEFEGQYENVRKFIYDLETAKDFVVIDDVALTEGTEPNAPLVVRIQLSTYYRMPEHG